MQLARLGAPLFVALATVAAGCGDDDSSSPTTVAPTTSAAAATSAAFPATVEHALGTTVVEESPQRVVTVGVTEQDFVLALGVTPVGVTDWYGDQPFATWPWAQDELGDAEPTVLVNKDGLDYEGIAALDPDLIIGTNAGLDDEAYGKLTAIAPTIAHPKDAPLYFSPWDDQFRLIGAALGKDAETTGIIDDIDAQFAAARDGSSRVRREDGDLPAERVLRRCGDRVPEGSRAPSSSPTSASTSRPSSTRSRPRGRRSSRSSS